MEIIDWRRDQELLQAPLCGVKPALLYMLIRGRNAWHNTWVRNYQGPRSLHSSTYSAREHAEQQRVNGSVFYITETPGLVLLTEAGPVTLVEFHSDDCFGRWNPARGAQTLALGAPIAAALASLGHDGDWRRPVPSAHSFVVGKARPKQVTSLPPKRPLKAWRSRAIGTAYSLAWDDHPNRHRRSGVNAVVRAFHSENGEATIETAEQTYWDAIEPRLAAEAEERRAMRHRLLALDGMIVTPLDLSDG